MRDKKQFNPKAFKEFAATLLLSFVYNIDDQKIKELVTNCSNKYLPRKKKRLIDPPMFKRVEHQHPAAKRKK